MQLTINLFLALLLSVCAFRPQIYSKRAPRPAALSMGAGKEAKRAWATGDLAGKDMFEDEDTNEVDMKKKFKLEPETVFFEGAPSASEVLLPALSVCNFHVLSNLLLNYICKLHWNLKVVTVIGVIPFVSSLARQAWVRYKFTSRRVSIQSGIGGKDQAEIIYPDIEGMKYVYRFGGAGDMVLTLKDGARVIASLFLSLYLSVFWRKLTLVKIRYFI